MTTTSPHALLAAVARLLPGILALCATYAPFATAAKPPQQIRQHIKQQIQVSVTPLQVPAANDLLTEPLWWVGVTNTGGRGKHYRIMAVQDGEVLRLYRHGIPAVRSSLVQLLPDDFRVTSPQQARQLIRVATALNIDTFGKPEAADVPAAAMRMDTVKHGYVFVDGERFNKATGYRLTVSDDGRVERLEYQLDLPVPPLTP